MSYPFRYLFGEAPPMSAEEWKTLGCQGNVMKFIVHEQFKTQCTQEEAAIKLHSIAPEFFTKYAPLWAKQAVVESWQTKKSST